MVDVADVEQRKIRTEHRYNPNNGSMPAFHSVRISLNKKEFTFNWLSKSNMVGWCIEITIPSARPGPGEQFERGDELGVRGFVPTGPKS